MECHFMLRNRLSVSEGGERRYGGSFQGSWDVRGRRRGGHRSMGHLRSGPGWGGRRGPLNRGGRGKQ